MFLLFIAVLEVTHVQLAHRYRGQWAVGYTVDHEAARAADTFPAVVIEGNGVFAFERQSFVQRDG